MRTRGFKNPEDFADVLYVWPLSLQNQQMNFFPRKIHISCLEFLHSLLVVVQNESVKKIKEVDPPSVY